MALKIRRLVSGAPRRRTLGAVALCLAAMACGDIELSTTSTLSERIETTPYRMVPAARSWVYVPNGLLTIERDLNSVVEQRIALPNDSAIPGDNFILLRARGGGPLSGGRMKLEDFVGQTGGVPAPFERVSNRTMSTGQDALGPYFVAEKTVGVDTTCVLVMRSLKNSARPLPRGADAVDVMMRNCTTRGREAAMRPITADRLGRVAGVTAVTGAPAALQTRSPFAAPQAVQR